MGLLAETVMSMPGAQVTTDKVTFRLSRVLALLLSSFSAPGGPQHLLFSPLLSARRGLLAPSKRPA